MKLQDKKADSPNVTHISYAFGYYGKIRSHAEGSVFEQAPYEIFDNPNIPRRFNGNKWNFINYDAQFRLDRNNSYYDVTYSY